MADQSLHGVKMASNGLEGDNVYPVPDSPRTIRSPENEQAPGDSSKSCMHEKTKKRKLCHYLLSLHPLSTLNISEAHRVFCASTDNSTPFT